MSPTDPIPNFNVPSTTTISPHHTTTFNLQSLYFPQTAYCYSIIMASPNPEPSKSATATSPSTSTAEPQKPECWTAQHDDELKLLALRGEDAPSIVELMITDYPCLVGKLTPEWVKEKIKDVGVAA